MAKPTISSYTWAVTGGPKRSCGGASIKDSPPSRGCNVNEFEHLKKLIAEAEEDIAKAIGGNKAAGTRARQTMQDIKNAAQAVREKILELRDAGKPQ